MYTSLGAHIRCTILLAILWVFIQADVRAQAAATGAPRTKPNTVVYKLKPAFGSNARVPQQAVASLQQTIKQVGAQNARQKFPKAAAPANARRTTPAVDLSLIYELKYKPGQSFEQVKNALLATGMVAYVEPLYIREPFHQPNDPLSDSLKTQQYYLKLLQAYRGWDVQQGDTNIVIGILDTGFRLSHSDLKANVKHNYNDPIDGIDNDNDGLVDNFSGWDFADNDRDVTDDTPYFGHGTGVSGAAAATPDNGKGIAGLGFKTRFLPLKVFSKSAEGNFGGFEAIVYAADKGCRVINLSWGGEGYSQLEQDIINYAVLEKDVVVVASAGNTNKYLDIYPASYDNVLSVGGTDKTDVKYKNYTYSYKIDVCAPSVDIYTTRVTGDDSYATGNGTSYAAPAVSGSAALIRAQFPELNALQVMERIRASSDDIYTLAGNQPYLEMLGKGRVNLKRALLDTNLKAVRATNIRLADGRIPQLGDTMALELDFVNYLAATDNVDVTLTCASPYIKILDGKFAVGKMATLGRIDNTKQPFRFTVLPGTPHNTPVYLRLNYTDGTYTDFQYIELYVNPDYVTLNKNNLHISINSKGNFGYNGFKFDQGVGVTYKGSNSLLFEGGLMVASGPKLVSDNVRNATWDLDNDFTPTSSARLDYKSKLANLEARTVLHDTYPSTTNVGVSIKHKAYAWASDPDKNFVILEYYIQNITPDTLKNVSAGLFADWNIGQDIYQNAADWDAVNNLGYVYSTSAATLPYAGIKLLTKDDPLYYAIDNIGGEDGAVSVSDGFTNDEKYKTLSHGVSRKSASGSGSGNDVSHVIGAAAKNLAPGEIKIIAFALLAADSLADLKKHAMAAQQKYYSIKTGPAPIAVTDTLCAGTPVILAPKGGTSYTFYADAEKKTILATGSTYTIPKLTQPTVVYISNTDSLFQSVAVPASYAIPAPPVAKFEINSDSFIKGTAVQFKNQSTAAKAWLWNFGNGDTSTAKDPVYTYAEPGIYKVQLRITDKFGCLEDTVSQALEIKLDTPTAAPDQLDKLLQLYPNPTTGLVKVYIANQGNILLSKEQITLTDMLGKTFYPSIKQVTNHEFILDLNGLADGVYLVRITLNQTTVTRRIILLKP
ncbi:S8 family serine peptidase [Pontibacter vulgaris]|uniref:S8 family serine peptidase n=1 Tax=Pontibacter vulgaris TaxID=2905679 RepID=UPI001FA7CC52|nr:S8 family serine peptidase [Pontibacter vulgaris]